MQDARRCTNLGLITAELTVTVCKPFQTNGELDITATDDVLDFEFRKLGVKAKLLNNASILARCQPGVVLRLRARDDHLARRKNQGCSLWIANSHNHCGETLLKWTNVGTVRTQSKRDTNLGIIFRIPSMQRNSLQVEPTVEIHGGNNILKGWDDALYGGDMLLLKSQRSGGGRNNCLSCGSSDRIGGSLSRGLRRWRGRRGSGEG